MRTITMFTGGALFFGVMGLDADDRKITAQPPRPATTATQTSRLTDQPTPTAYRLVADKVSADEAAIRQASQAFVTAYGQGNAQVIAKLFTQDAEYVDELGNLFQGRPAIQESMTDFFADHPGCKLEVKIDSIRVISPGIAVEDGTTTITHADGATNVDSLYTTVHVKTDGQWLAASIRDHAPKNRRLHRSQLQQLTWLLGDWVDEGDESIVRFSCQLVDNGNFLLRKFTIQVVGQEAMTGSQRIGWDPLTGKLRAWIFDSEGAYGEGLWHRDGADWVLKSTGVTPGGQTTSNTSIYKFVNDHTMTWQAVQQEIAGVQQPDSEIVTIVRQAPAPAPGLAADPK